MRISRIYKIEDVAVFKRAALSWSQQFYEAVCLEGNSAQSQYSSFDTIFAVDGLTSIKTDSSNAFQELKEYQQHTRDWMFGYLSYDLKNNVEHLKSQNFDGLEFPELYFFQPKKIIVIRGDQVEFNYLKMVDDEIDLDFKAIVSGKIMPETQQATSPKIKLRTAKEDYFNQFQQIINHIHKGDIYEVNYCQEFYALDTIINPVDAFQQLNDISKAPFATFFKLKENYIISASPERYIKKEGNKVISQPIKGTAKRGNTLAEDRELKYQLENDVKERSENIMIVDLVRNDLSKTAVKGSVTVEELCKVYTFEQVHQMISTISSEVKNGMNPVDIIATTFPMGSMTGAPKIAAMKIIEEVEFFKRGVYSGSVGYFTPEGDFDFNVIIRTILYNATKKYVSFSVGGAITAKSQPHKEYEECLIKAKAMREVLEKR